LSRCLDSTVRYNRERLKTAAAVAVVLLLLLVYIHILAGQLARPIRLDDIRTALGF